jgi:hypothetical protein
MCDTPLDIEKRIARMTAERTPAERLKMASSMFDSGRNLISAGLRAKNSSINVAQLRTQTFLRLYGESYKQDEIERIIKSIPNMQDE